MAYGFIPVGGINGHPYNGATVRCVKLAADASNIHIGDFVKLDGTGDATGVPSVNKVAAGNVIFGAVVAVEAVEAVSTTYAPASAATDRYLHVAVATPDMLFKCNPSAAVAKTDVGRTADISVSNGTAPFYTSKSSLDQTNLGTAPAQLQIVGFVQNGIDVTSTSADLIVRVAEPQIGLMTASVGV
jgi:hypothetical protein